MQNEQPGSTWRVLVIEDEEDNRDVIASALMFYRMTVKTAANGLEAIALLGDFVPDFMLCDLAMPKMDGWQTLAAIRSDPKWLHIPVIALTAYAMKGDKEKALAKGFDGYITKPIDVLTIFTTLKTILSDIAKKMVISRDDKPNVISATTIQPTITLLAAVGQGDHTDTASHNNSVAQSQ